MAFFSQDRPAFRHAWAFASLLIAACGHVGGVTPQPGQIDSPMGAAPHVFGATPHPIVWKHVQTWGNVGESGGTDRVTMAQAAPWLTYVLTTPALSSAAREAGIKPVAYTDPNRQAPGGPMWTQNEATFAHDCSGHRITVSGAPTDVMDPHSTVLHGLWPAFVRLEKSWGAQFAYVFEDSADEVNPQRFSALPCGFNQDDWTSATNAMDGYLGAPIIYNGLGFIPSNGPAPGPAIALNATTTGGMSEDCYVGRTPNGYFYAPHWQASENTELQMAAAGKLFICHADSYGYAKASTALRTYFYASFLLTYDRLTSIVDTQFVTPSGLGVMPETELIPKQPLVPTPADVSSLLLPSGLYGREYGDCYLSTLYVGHCAVVVNPNNPHTSGPKAFPWPGKYQHTLVMTGEGAYDGGTVSPNGPPPPALIKGGSAEIVFP